MGSEGAESRMASGFEMVRIREDSGYRHSASLVADFLHFLAIANVG